MVAPPWMSHTTLRPEVIRGYRDAPPNTVAEILAGELHLNAPAATRARQRGVCAR